MRDYLAVTYNEILLNKKNTNEIIKNAFPQIESVH